MRSGRPPRPEPGAWRVTGALRTVRASAAALGRCGHGSPLTSLPGNAASRPPRWLCFPSCFSISCHVVPGVSSVAQRPRRQAPPPTAASPRHFISHASRSTAHAPPATSTVLQMTGFLSHGERSQGNRNFSNFIARSGSGVQPRFLSLALPRPCHPSLPRETRSWW